MNEEIAMMKAFAEMTGLEVEAIPEPITAGALGAALKVLRAVGQPDPAKEVAE